MARPENTQGVRGKGLQLKMDQKGSSSSVRTKEVSNIVNSGVSLCFHRADFLHSCCTYLVKYIYSFILHVFYRVPVGQDPGGTA